MGTFDKEPRRTSRKPWGTALLAALTLGFASDAGAQQAQGRPVTRADMVAISGEAEVARREEYSRRRQEEYERRMRNDPAFREAERRRAEQDRADAIYCEGIRKRIEREGFTAVMASLEGGEEDYGC